MKRSLIIAVICLLISHKGLCANKTIDLTNLDSVKHYLTGNWMQVNSENNVRFSITFSTDGYQGNWNSNDVISTAPIFNLIRDEDRTLLRFMDITGGTFDYEVCKLTRKKLVLIYKKQIMRFVRTAWFF